MSSNIRIKRICKNCENEFIAKTTSTQCCSDLCAKGWYKKKQRVMKIEKSNTEVRKIKSKPLEDIRAKEFLTVQDVAKLLSSCKQTIYNLINNGTITAYRLTGKNTLIKRVDVDKLFENPVPMPKPININVEDYYSLSEVMYKYGVSNKALYDIIKRHEIPKIKKGIYTYVSKETIDKMFE
jgi:excisionase family DNA binding protein